MNKVVQASCHAVSCLGHTSQRSVVSNVTGAMRRTA